MKSFFCALLLLVAWAFGTSAQELPIRESFSLNLVLKELGFTPHRSSHISLRSEQDMIDAIRGRVPGENARVHQEYFWPFTSFAASPNLSVMAVSLDPRAFPSLQGSRAVTALISIPDKQSTEPRLIWKPTFQPGATVTSLDFMSENLVRAGVMVDTSSDPLNLGYQIDYLFFDVTNNRKMFSIKEDLDGLGTVYYLRHYSKDFYLVASARNKRGTDQGAELIFDLVHYDPLTRESKILFTTLDPRLGSTLLHDPVDQPGRDITVLSNGLIQVRFSLFEEDHWQKYELTADRGDARIERLSHESLSSYQPIVNSDQFLTKISGYDFEILKRGESGLERLVSDDRVSPYQRVYRVTKGFLGVEANHPQYSTYLYQPGQATRLLLGSRQIQATYLDGGFAGLSITNRSAGDVILTRVIYDSESLNHAEVGMAEEASLCADELLARLQDQLKQKK